MGQPQGEEEEEGWKGGDVGLGEVLCYYVINFTSWNQ